MNMCMCVVINIFLNLNSLDVSMYFKNINSNYREKGRRRDGARQCVCIREKESERERVSGRETM